MPQSRDITATAPMWASDGQYYLHGSEFDPTGFSYTGFNGLLAPLTPGASISTPGTFAIILTGTETGPLTVTLELRTTAPPPPALDLWDEIVEASLHLPDGDAFLIDAHDHTPFPSLAAYTGSPCRIRAHARGRDKAHSIGIVQTPVEEHLIQIWPAPATGITEHKLTDHVGTLSH
ncbi:hypothetical protein [Streptomyces sp. C]|uniref:hypothetical protein n=1 Tax=Streptomyces sp. C TaxID=253839 RepID=UPI0001B4F9F6|nr:hypothetical protein [Streptomyces sp. C]EFL19933.1 predicted protein [Streptomyces sp. C]